MRLVLLLLLFAPLSFALEVRDSIVVSTKVVPQYFYLTLSAEAEGETPDEVVKTLSAVDRFIKSNYSDYEGGHFVVNPVREIDPATKKETLKGYRGRIHYRLKLRGVKEEELLLNGLEKLRKELKGLNYRIYTEGWRVDEEFRSKLVKGLKLKALEEASKRAAEYGAVLNKVCKLQKVSLRESIRRPPILRPLKAGAPLPERGEVKLSVQADATFECY